GQQDRRNKKDHPQPDVVRACLDEPGFIKQNILLNNNEVSISLDSFKKILVISSFKAGERISNDIKNELHRVIKECNDPSIN
ncbi:hypothetical protein, partial [Klebsiella pneumoniae]|uniref:hypothetical protein n=1 Tax=Klebsiella pneumoniae TaxID=573 RepID=UPI00298E8263